MQLAPRQLELFSRMSRPPPARVVNDSPAPAPAPPPPASRMETLERARTLALHLTTYLPPGTKVLLTVHDNRSTMLSYRRKPPLLKIRAHHLFLDAPPEVVQAIAEYTGQGQRQSSRHLDEWIAQRQHAIAALPARRKQLDSRGRCFDLKVLFDELNQALFGGEIVAKVGWGRHAGKRTRRSIRLGVYDHRTKEIRIHPALDNPDVPRFFVEFIVFHEMLHQVFPSARDAGRHVHHPKAFRDRERTFPRYELAMAWEKAHLKELLRR